MTNERAKEVQEAIRRMATEGPVSFYEEGLLREAADELERLREENADLRERFTGQAASEAAADAQRYLLAKDAEIARLREALAARTATMTTHMAEHAALAKRFVALEAERDTLRDALKPWAELAAKVPRDASDEWTMLITVAMLRHAAEVLK